MFDVVLFDLDGTLVDSAPDIVRALNATLAEASLPTHPLDTARTFVGDGAGKLIERALPTSLSPDEAASQLARLLPRFQSHYAAHLCDETTVYPGVRETLEALCSRGIAMAVVTNKPIALADALLADLDLARFFRRVLGDGSGFPRKPDPHGALTVLKELGRSPRETALVGDGVPDARLARALPCAGFAAGWGYTQPEVLLAEGATVVLARPEELLRHF